jgi:hypothetical protein
MDIILQVRKFVVINSFFVAKLRALGCHHNDEPYNGNWMIAFRRRI